jgi:hypothetical protein
MSEYTTRFRAEGFDTLEAILDIARADLTQVALSTDGHRVLLVYLDGIFAAMEEIFVVQSSFQYIILPLLRTFRCIFDQRFTNTLTKVLWKQKISRGVLTEILLQSRIPCLKIDASESSLAPHPLRIKLGFSPPSPG